MVIARVAILVRRPDDALIALAVVVTGRAVADAGRARIRRDGACVGADDGGAAAAPEPSLLKGGRVGVGAVLYGDVAPERRP